MKNERYGMADSVIIVHRDKNGKVLDVHRYPEDFGWLHKALVKLGLKHNTITQYGMAIAAKLLTLDVGETAFDYIGIGTGTTPAAVTDNALETEKKRKAGTGTTVTTTKPNDTMQIVATFSSADGLSGTDNITEVGVFNAATGDEKILFRIVYSPADVCNWDQGDTLEVTAKCQMKQGS